jgi:copper chaperone
MKTLNFKTTLATHEAVEAVSEPLNDIEQIDGWNVDLDSPEKLLTVQTTDNRITDLVLQAVAKAGYEATPVSA